MRLTPAQVEEVRSIVARHPRVGRYAGSDLPNTILLE